jgi:Prokaryotic E2 family E
MANNATSVQRADAAVVTTLNPMAIHQQNASVSCVLITSAAVCAGCPADLPLEIAEAKGQGKLPPKAEKLKIALTVQDLPGGKHKQFKAALTDTLREVFEHGAQELGKPLLPSSSMPLDTLHYRKRGDWSESLTGFDRPLWLALAQGSTRRLGIDYKLVVKINTKWGIAPLADATPRTLLEAFGFSPNEFSLYAMDSAEPLPPDTPLALQRGQTFEAQKDGRYGAPVGSEVPPRGTQTIEDDVNAVREAGVEARLFVEGGQQYVELQNLPVPSPPWSSNRANIVVAVPATYPMSGLDALYVELPFSQVGGGMPYQQSVAQINGRQYALISWHYATSKPWNALRDDLASHVEHCRGFFLRRGVSS